MCYMARSDRGGQMSALRLVGAHSDDAWAAPAGIAPSEAAGEGANWVRTTLAETSKSRSIAVLCLDADGAVCSWVSAPSTDAELVRATIESAAGTGFEDDGGLEGGSHGRFPDLPGETSYEPLGEPGGSGQQRLAVLAVPEVPARMLIDELDTRGVRVGRSISLWHAAAQAWDPSGPASNGVARTPAVADHAPATAVVLIDPEAPRLVWCWTLRGALIAGGSIRLRASREEDHTGAVVTSASLGRLASEWLSWSVQLGVAPDRIVCVGSVDADAEGGLDAAAVGDAIGSRWPGASVAVVDDPDPIGTTLRRLVAAEDLGRTTPSEAGPARSSLTALTGRPTRAHRSMHVWAGVALAIGAVGVAAAAFQVWGDKGAIDRETKTVRDERQAMLTEIDPTIAASFFPMRELEALVTRERTALAPDSGFPVPPPVMDQLEIVSLVLGMPGIELVMIDIRSPVGVQAQVRVEDIAMAEDLDQALRAVEGSNVRWSTFRTETRRNDDKITVTFNSTWRDRE